MKEGGCAGDDGIGLELLEEIFKRVTDHFVDEMRETKNQSNSTYLQSI